MSLDASQHGPASKGKFWHASTTGHALLVSALGLLLVFRTNTASRLHLFLHPTSSAKPENPFKAYSRFWEGRQIWQRILDLGRLISTGHCCGMCMAFCIIACLRDVSRYAIIFRQEMGPQTSAHVCNSSAHQLCLPCCWSSTSSVSIPGRLVQAFPYCMIEHLRGKKARCSARAVNGV